MGCLDDTSNFQTTEVSKLNSVLQAACTAAKVERKVVFS